MIIAKHNPGCKLAEWQLRVKVIDGKKDHHLAACLNCGATHRLTDTEADNWFGFQRLLAKFPDCRLK